ncbi:hypothetical protein GCM10009779_04440 [Polymorphospora rubra]|uniref:Uncharacterized protein n=1 Tax=Polymorphospora rubra TaxID=338584 RepID=A0A810MRV3_9ACTN|nr:hypothetical protein Prubr_02110 [Polymorphospora rubra]
MSARYGRAKATMRRAVPRVNRCLSTVSWSRIERSMLQPPMPPPAPDIGWDTVTSVWSSVGSSVPDTYDNPGNNRILPDPVGRHDHG